MAKQVNSAAQRRIVKNISKACRQTRKNLGLTQGDISATVGVNRDFYARIERGQALPSVPVFAALTDALGLSADWMLGRSDVPGTYRPYAPIEYPPDVRRVLTLILQAEPSTLRLISILLRTMGCR